MPQLNGPDPWWGAVDGGVVFERLEVRDDLDLLVEDLREVLLEHGGPAVGIAERHGEGEEQVDLDERAVAGVADAQAVVRESERRGRAARRRPAPGWCGRDRRSP